MQRLGGVLAILALVFVIFSGGVKADNYFCDSQYQDIWCASVPRDQNNNIIFNPPIGGNASLPWVFNDTVNLPAGLYTPGPAPWTNLPTIYVMGNGRLNLYISVQLEANIFLCDNARLDIKDTVLRIGASYQFQYSLWAMGNSRVTMSNVTLYTVSVAQQTLSQTSPGAWFVVIRSNAMMTSDIMAPGRDQDALELASLDFATVNVNRHSIVTETYVAKQATFINKNSYYFDVFFELCTGFSATIPSFPSLCSIDGTGTMPACNQPGHQPINFTYSVPGGLSYQITNCKVFSWAVVTYEGTTASLSNVPKDANLGIGLRIGDMNKMQTSYTLQMTGGDNPSVTGLQGNRDISFNNVYVLVWQCWGMANYLKITVENSDHVGDILPDQNSVVVVKNTDLNYGQLRATTGTTVVLSDLTARESVLVNAGGTLIATNTAFTQLFETYSNVFILDSPFPTLTIYSGGALYYIYLTSPQDHNLSGNETVTVAGTVSAYTTGGVAMTPFPTATVKLNGQTVLTISSAIFNATITTIPYSSFQPGNNVLTVGFNVDVNGTAVATRTLTIQTSGSSVLSPFWLGSYRVMLQHVVAGLWRWDW